MKIEQIPDLNIIFMRKTGAYGAENAKLMESFKQWLTSNHLLNDESVILGIAQDNPSFVQPEDCRYDVALIVSDFNGISDSNIMRGVVKGGKYAIFKIHHTAEAMQKAWKEIFNEISREGHLLDSTRPIMERYAIQLLNNHYCEICVPIQ